MLNDFYSTVALIQQNLPFLLLLMGGLWLIQLLNFLLGYRLNIFGLYPRSWHGFIGIFLSPFLHGNFNHLFFNSIPLFVLACFISLQGWTTFYYVSVFIILFSGFAVWLIGRPAIHIGASGLIMGYWSYLLLNAYHQGTLLAIVLGGVCLYYFGGFFMSIIPTDRKTSWEGHFFGFLAGIVAAYVVPIVLKN